MLTGSENTRYKICYLSCGNFSMLFLETSDGKKKKKQKTTFVYVIICNPLKIFETDIIIFSFDLCNFQYKKVTVGYATFFLYRIYSTYILAFLYPVRRSYARYMSLFSV